MGVAALSLLMPTLFSQEPSHSIRSSGTGSMEDTSKDFADNTTTSNTSGAVTMLKICSKAMVITTKGMGNSNFTTPALHPSSSNSLNNSKYPSSPKDRQPLIQNLL